MLPKYTTSKLTDTVSNMQIDKIRNIAIQEGTFMQYAALQCNFNNLTNHNHIIHAVLYSDAGFSRQNLYNQAVKQFKYKSYDSCKNQAFSCQFRGSCTPKWYLCPKFPFMPQVKDSSEHGKFTRPR